MTGEYDIENNIYYENKNLEDNKIQEEEDEWGFFIVLDADENKSHEYYYNYYCSHIINKNVCQNNLYHDNFYYKNTMYQENNKLLLPYLNCISPLLQKRNNANTIFHGNFGNIALLFSTVVFIANLFIVNNLKK